MKKLNGFSQLIKKLKKINKNFFLLKIYFIFFILVALSLTSFLCKNYNFYYVMAISIK